MVKLIILIFIININLFSEDLEIPVVLSSKSQINLKVLSGFSYSIKNKIKILNLEEDKLEIDKLLVQDKREPVVTIGTQATYYARKNSNRKVIFSNTSFSRDGIQYEKGGACGYFSEIPFKKFFMILKELKPKLKHIAILYSISSPNYYTIESNSQDIVSGMIIKTYKINDIEQIDKDLENIAKSTEALFVIADPLYNQENFEKVSEFSKKRNIILFSNLSSLTDLGLSFSLDADIFEVGIQTGNLVNNVVINSDVCDMGPFSFPEKDILKFNQDYMFQSGLEVPAELKQRTELEEINATGVELYFNGKKGTALNIFQYVLSKSPNNESANKFSNLIINEKYDTQVKGVLSEAERLFESKKYMEAKIQYEKVLKINPNITGIKEKIVDCNIQFSEQKRNEANNQINGNNPFFAIQTFNEALKYYPQNMLARQGLNTLRSKLSEKIPSMMEEGLVLYNHRKYNESIPVFKNILLIDEVNKKAKEYLRLSIDKKEAIDKLMNCKKDKENPCSL